MEEEKHLFSHEQMELLEPRPWGGRSAENVHVVGIFEVLDGKC